MILVEIYRDSCSHLYCRPIGSPESYGTWPLRGRNPPRGVPVPLRLFKELELTRKRLIELERELEGYRGE